MNDATVISKNQTLLHSQDYQWLRKAGLGYIESLGSDLWTDYNTHDPGITIMELLCYAITELGYRTDFDIKDLMAEENNTDPYQMQAFFSSRNILTCEPLTDYDYRKLLIDIPGIQNAWLKTDGQNEIPIYADCKTSTLVFAETPHQVSLRGLYRVFIEFETDDGLGDINDFTFPLTFDVTGNRSITATVILPDYGTWNFDLIQSVYSKNIAGISFIQTQKNTWQATLIVKNKGTDQSLQFFIHIDSNPERIVIDETILQKEMNKKDTTDIFHSYFKRHEKIKTILGAAEVKLMAHRNLCEDFVSILPVKSENFSVCADIETAANADIEEISGNIYFLVENYLNPPVNFYSLKEMMIESIAVDEIFEGPVLEHGFIKTDELLNTNLRQNIYTSDLIDLVMGINGVLAVNNIQLIRYDNYGEIAETEKWIMPVSANRKPLLAIEKCKILFFKNKLPYIAHSIEALDTLEYLQALNNHSKLTGGLNDIDMPFGNFRDTEDYFSIQYELPQTYGVGDTGLPFSATDDRKAKAAQLKAYLLFYDQILANFFSQLRHAKDIFSLDANLKQTYFTQFLNGIKDINKIYADETTLQSVFQQPDLSNNDVKKLWNDLAEDDETFFDRRNRSLDHLLSRFAESFNDYVLQLYSVDGSVIDEQKLIQDKINFLKQYPALSSGRGKAFNYAPPSNDDLWDTDNVSGIEKRVAVLTGIENYNRRFLFCWKAGVVDEIKNADGTISYSFKIVDNNDKTILVSAKTYATKTDAKNDIQLLGTIDVDGNSFHAKFDAATGKYSYLLVNATGDTIASAIAEYDSITTARNAAKDLLSQLATDCNDEGFHLIEHILLRPRTIAYNTPEVCLDKNCDFCGSEDPYSFHASVILPYWPERFQNINFRRYFEQTIREEAPAHVALKICWVNSESLHAFEVAYKNWLRALKNNALNLDKKTNALILLLNTLHSEYPIATLHDCDESKDRNPVVLGSTILGTYNQKP
jgi:uncharacterized protein YegP (UPF0339 family)